MTLYVISATSPEECPTGIVSLHLPAAGTDSYEYNETLVRQRKEQRDSGIRWQVILVHEVQNEAEDRSLTNAEEMGQSREHTPSSLTLEMRSIKYDRM